MAAEGTARPGSCASSPTSTVSQGHPIIHHRLVKAGRSSNRNTFCLRVRTRWCGWRSACRTTTMTASSCTAAPLPSSQPCAASWRPASVTRSRCRRSCCERAVLLRRLQLLGQRVVALRRPCLMVRMTGVRPGQGHPGWQLPGPHALVRPVRLPDPDEVSRSCDETVWKYHASRGSASSTPGSSSSSTTWTACTRSA